MDWKAECGQLNL